MVGNCSVGKRWLSLSCSYRPTAVLQNDFRSSWIIGNLSAKWHMCTTYASGLLRCNDIPRYIQWRFRRLRTAVTRSCRRCGSWRRMKIRLELLLLLLWRNVEDCRVEGTAAWLPVRDGDTAINRTPPAFWRPTAKSPCTFRSYSANYMDTSRVHPRSGRVGSDFL